MAPEESFDEITDLPPEQMVTEALPPLPQGRPASREESVERMYARYAKTFEALSK